MKFQYPYLELIFNTDFHFNVSPTMSIWQLQSCSLFVVKTLCIFNRWDNEFKNNNTLIFFWVLVGSSCLSSLPVFVLSLIVRHQVIWYTAVGSFSFCPAPCWTLSQQISAGGSFASRFLVISSCPTWGVTAKCHICWPFCFGVALEIEV